MLPWPTATVNTTRTQPNLSKIVHCRASWFELRRIHCEREGILSASRVKQSETKYAEADVFQLTPPKRELAIHDVVSPLVPDPFVGGGGGGGGDVVLLVALAAPDLSFELNKLWKKCCNTSCCVCPVGLGLGTDGDVALFRPEIPVPVANEPTARVLRDNFRGTSDPLTLAPRFIP